VLDDDGRALERLYKHTQYVVLSNKAEAAVLNKEGKGT
jgi:hypothetical protein